VSAAEERARSGCQGASSNRHDDAPTPSKEWNVLAEGPSIYAATPRDLLRGPIVAINDAVRLRHLGRARYWAVIDAPSPRRLNVWQRNCAHLPRPLTVWLPERRRREWLKIQRGDKNYSSRWGWLELEPHARNPSAQPGSWDEISECLSVFMALRECAAHGGTRIRLFGCDMEGVGNAVLGWKKKENATYVERWNRERKLMERYIDLAAARGITIERWRPPKEPKE